MTEWQEAGGYFPWEDTLQSPRKIKEYLDTRIVGNEDAKREASLILYNAFSNRRSVSLFIGPSGSGKTEIFRALKDEFPEHVYIFDGSTLTAPGWKGLSIDELFESNRIYGDFPVIIVIDEYDKLIRPAYSGSGSQSFNVADLIQSSLLRLFDGDTVNYESSLNKSRSFTVDSKNLTFVLLGAFTELWEKRRHPKRNKSLGFGSKDIEETVPDISIDDVIAWGCKPELASRINRIVLMDDPDEEAMTEIGYHTVKTLEDEYRSKITVTRPLMRELAQKAIEKGLGARYIKTEIIERLDRIQFDDPDTEEYVIE